jgi:hypothetical protein
VKRWFPESFSTDPVDYNLIAEPVRAHQTSQAAPNSVEPGMTANARTLPRSRVESGDPLHAPTNARLLSIK